MMSKELMLLEEIFNDVVNIQEPEKTKRKKKSKNKKKEEVLLGLKYLIVMDFEATCWEKPYGRGKPQEIIEFPACLLNLTTGEIEKVFHSIFCVLNIFSDVFLIFFRNFNITQNRSSNQNSVIIARI